MTSSILVEKQGSLRLITLNRPEALNAFDDQMHSAFSRLVADLDDDRDARAVVITGQGRAFCAGGSLQDFEAKRVDRSYRSRSMRQAKRLVEEMIDLRLPVVAAVNGPAIGLGCTLATLADVVFMADTAFLSDPHVSVALVAGDGAALTWPASMSLHLAKQYLLTGDRIPALDAQRIGLANFVVPSTGLLEAALAFASRLAAQPPQAVQQTKLLLNHHLRANAPSVLTYGLSAESQSHDSDEYREIASKASLD